MDERVFDGYFSDQIKVQEDKKKVPHEEVPTKRQLQIMTYLSHGFSTVMVSEELKISLHTVHKHVENVRTRMGAKTRGHTIAKLFRSGYLK